MGALKAVFKKELKGYFDSPTAYIFIIIFLVLNSWLFLKVFFLQGQASLRGFFDLMPWMLLFFVPAVSMKLWAEEKKMGTMEILFTLPVRDYEIIAGKYLAGLSLVIMALACSLPLAVTAGALGDTDNGVIFAQYMGTILLAGLYLSIGIFISSLTNNQIIAFILSVAFIFLLILIGQNIVLFSLPSFLVPVFSHLGLYSHYEGISRGVLDTRDLLYFIFMTLFFLYLNVKSLESRRWRG